MSEIARNLAIQLAVALVAALLLATWRARRPWRPSWIDRWMHRHFTRKVAGMHDLLPAERAARAAALEEIVKEPPPSERSFATKFRHEFLTFGVAAVLAVVTKPVLEFLF